jgi:hypothetical protein
MVDSLQNRGQQILDELVQKHGTLRAVAALVPSIHENQLGNYHRGTSPRKPLIDARKTLESELGIPFFSWDEPALVHGEEKGAA